MYRNTVLSLFTRKRGRSIAAMGLLFVAFVTMTTIACTAPSSPSKTGPFEDGINPDERVLLFPTVGWKSERGNRWNVRVHGWIFEPEQEGILRDLVTSLAMEYFEDEDLTPARRRRFRRRFRYFVVDNEGGQRLTARIAGERFLLPESDGDGRFQTTIKLPEKQVKKYAKEGRLRYILLPGWESGKAFPMGTIHLIPEQGTTVISDIDDTIKISNVNNRTKLLRNTFLKPFKPVPNMAAKYREWSARKNVEFLYLSNSPWQLYPPLSEFLFEHSFPSAPVDLLRVQLDDHRLFHLFEESKEKKLPRLTGYFERYPDRAFVLIGDSGEADPEIYGELARRYPEQVRRILIRNVTDEEAGAERFQKAFNGIPRSRWTLFRRGDQLHLE